MVRIFIAASLLSLSLASTAAIAYPEQETRSQVVSYSDLKLTDPAGVEELKRRISSAVTAVCGERFSTELAARADIRRCRHDAMARADTALLAAVEQEQRLASRRDGGFKVAAR